jgi:hypothetical protein
LGFGEKPIPDPGSATLLVTKRAGVVHANCVPGTDVTYKIKYYFIFKLVKKNLLAKLQRIIELFARKIFIKL